VLRGVGGFELVGQCRCGAGLRHAPKGAP
jgi:hypothetical protein